MRLEHALLAGGGSGGHVFPALAVAEELRRRGWRVTWLGRVEGMERELVEKTGLPYQGLPARAVVGRNAWQRAAAVPGIGISALRAQWLIRHLDVNVVLGTGGYASVPGVLGAVLARRPVVLLEPNAVSGVANRWLSRWAAVAAVTDAEAARDLRCPARVTGIPVREEFLAETSAASRNGSVGLLIVGGSQGARQLNLMLPAAVARLAAEHPGIRVTHQVGAGLVNETRAAYRDQEVDSVDLRIVPFLEDMAGAMSAAHLVVSRAGAVTLAEICAAGRAALLLPLALAGAHQTANARRLCDAGGAEMLTAEEATPEAVAEILSRLLQDRTRLREMGERLRLLARPQAAVEIADLLQEVVRAA